MFRKITNQQDIEATLRAYLTQPDKQPARFLATIKQRSKNLIHEGAAPLSVATDKNGQVWSLTNSDYNYQRPYAIVALSDIEYVEVLQQWK